jgi:dihydropteroate synthase
LSVRRNRFLEIVKAAQARRGCAIMGVLNVTPDSFSDGGHFSGREQAIARVDELVAEGADIVDIGGESTRPGAARVAAEVQLERVLEVVRYAAAKSVVSIDTTSAKVAAACLDAGAHCVNDVSCLEDPELAHVAAGSGAAYVLSHARARQEKMAGFGGWPLSAYDDIVKDVVADLERAATRAAELGLGRDSLIFDPGLGFSKASRHSFELLRRAHEVVASADVPWLFGASRKSFLGLVDKEAKPEERLGASIQAASHAARSGVAIVRVHDVRATRQAIDMDVVLGTRTGHGVGGTYKEEAR